MVAISQGNRVDWFAEREFCSYGKRVRQVLWNVREISVVCESYQPKWQVRKLSVVEVTVGSVKRENKQTKQEVAKNDTKRQTAKPLMCSETFTGN